MSDPRGPGPVVLTVEEAGEVLGVLGRAGLTSPEFAVLRTRALDTLARRIREAVHQPDDAVGALHSRLHDLEATHDRMVEQFEALQERTARLTETTTELRRQGQDLAAVARAVRRLVQGRGALAAIPAEDPDLVAIREALDRLAA